jgi:hypothetical protein
MEGKPGNKNLGSYLDSKESYLKDCESEELENRRKVTQAIFGLSGLGDAYGVEKEFEKEREKQKKA